MSKVKIYMQISFFILPLVLIILVSLFLYKQDLSGFLIPVLVQLGFYLSWVYLIIFGQKGEWSTKLALYLRNNMLTKLTNLLIYNFIFLFLIIIFWLLLYEQSELNLRGDIVIKCNPINGVAEIVVVGIESKYKTNNKGFFDFHIKDENQEQLTLRGTYKSWIGSKLVSKNNFLSIELPLYAQLIDNSSRIQYPSNIPTVLIGNLESSPKSFLSQVWSNQLYNKPISEIAAGTENYIEFLVTDPELLEVKISPINVMHNNSAIIIAVSNYLDPRIPNSVYSVHDARNIKGLISEKIWDFKNVPTLVDDMATLHNVKSTLHQNITLSEQECILFYFSGHWYMDKKHKKLYLLLYDSSLDNVVVSSLAFEELYSTLQMSQAKKIIILLEGMSDYLMPKVIGPN